jgi:hypothetical protein
MTVYKDAAEGFVGRVQKWLESKIEQIDKEIDEGGDYRYLDAQLDILNEVIDWIEGIVYAKEGGEDNG